MYLVTVGKSTPHPKWTAQNNLAYFLSGFNVLRMRPCQGEKDLIQGKKIHSPWTLASLTRLSRIVFLYRGTCYSRGCFLPSTCAKEPGSSQRELPAHSEEGCRRIQLEGHQAASPVMGFSFLFNSMFQLKPSCRILLR